jgi:ABC-type molybdate transport system substrate-binding protein
MPTRKLPPAAGISRRCSSNGTSPTRPSAGSHQKSAISGGAELIANGDVDIGLYLLSEVLTVKGVAVAGMLPSALQNYIVYAGAVLADSPSPDVALEFIKFLADPSKQAQWKTTGFESIGKGN